MADMCYIAKRPCGCIGLYMTEEYAKTPDGRKSISKALGRGYTVDRVPHESVAGSVSYCETCDPERVARKQQMELVAEVRDAR